MKWVINKTFKWGQHKYSVYLTVDKELNPFSRIPFLPAVWTGFVSADLNNAIDKNEKGDIELRQDGYTSFDAIKYPAFASGIYDQILEEIDNELRSMD